MSASLWDAYDATLRPGRRIVPPDHDPGRSPEQLAALKAALGAGASPSPMTTS